MSKDEQRRDPESAGTVMLSDSASKLVDRAFDIAEEQRDDHVAVDELVALTGGSRRILRQLERFSRQHGMHKEDRDRNRLQRLLQAAITSSNGVVPPTPEDERVFELLERFHTRTSDEQWQELVERQPALELVANDVDDGRFGQLARAGLHDESLSNDDYTRLLNEESVLQSRLTVRLQQVLGPAADSADLLVRSRTALNAAQLRFRPLTR